MPVATLYSKHCYNFLTLLCEKFVVFLLGVIAYRTMEPIKNNTNKHNSHILIGIRDWFLEHEDRSFRWLAFKGLMNYAIFKYETSNYYSDRADKVMEKLLKSDWVYLEGKNLLIGWKNEGTKSNKELRREALIKALNEKDFPKVLNLVD